MTIAFYLILVFFSDAVEFHWGWCILAFLMSSNEAKTVYRYTTDASLAGKNVKEC